MHRKGVIHRDLKPSNILIDKDANVKIADFGLTRKSNSMLDEAYDNMTDYVASRWYRAPEILLGSNKYDEKADMWSVGCILAELMLGRVLFEGSSTLDQLEKIFELMGRPSSKDLKEIGSPVAMTMISAIQIAHQKNIQDLFSGQEQESIDLLKLLLTINPKLRISANDALNHPYIQKLAGNDINAIELMKQEQFVMMEFDDNVLYEVSDYKQYIRKMVDEKAIKRRRIDDKEKKLYNLARKGKKRSSRVTNRMVKATIRGTLYTGNTDNYQEKLGFLKQSNRVNFEPDTPNFGDYDNDYEEEEDSYKNNRVKFMDNKV